MRRASKILTLLLQLMGSAAFAMDAADYGEFQKLMHTPVRILTDKAEAIMAAKYETLDYILLHPPNDLKLITGLPAFASSNRTISAAYRIATKRPELIASHLCYDPACDNLKLKNLLDCFFINSSSGEYAEHAATIETCRSEAILIFLWDDMGSSQGEINAALRFMFDPSVHEAPPMSLN